MRIREVMVQDIPGIAKVQVDGWRTTYRGIVPDEFLDNMAYTTQEMFLEKEFVPHLYDKELFCYVAEEQIGQVVGFAVGGKEREKNPNYTGELHGIYILKEYQRRGFGRKLVRAVVKKLLKMKLTSMLVWVLVENPSRGFYERLGGVELNTKKIEIGGALLDEVAYGWSDITTLL